MTGLQQNTEVEVEIREKEKERRGGVRERDGGRGKYSGVEPESERVRETLKGWLQVNIEVKFDGLFATGPHEPANQRTCPGWPKWVIKMAGEGERLGMKEIWDEARVIVGKRAQHHYLIRTFTWRDKYNSLTREKALRSVTWWRCVQ